MRKITFTRLALNRIAGIRSIHFTDQETARFQVELIGAIRTRLSAITPLQGYREYNRGPWANTRRILVWGYKVYYAYSSENDKIVVKGIKAPGMK